MADTERRLRNTIDTAAYLNLSPNTLNAWRVQGIGPRFLKLGQRVVYAQEDIEAYLERNRHAATVKVA